MAYQGEDFVARYGAGAAERTPPVREMIERGARVSAGTDATRVASYDPWVALAWLVTGRTVGGLRLYPERACLDRETALRLWTEKVSWFSNEEGRKGRLQAGQLADFAVLDRDYFTAASDQIASIASVLTVVGGKVVYGAEEYADLAPPPPPPMPDWSPVGPFGGVHKVSRRPRPADPGTLFSRACGCASPCGVHGHAHGTALGAYSPTRDARAFWGVFGCSCWAV